MENEQQDAVTKLNKDLRAAIQSMSPSECRYLVDAYYIIQEDRKRSGNQIKAMDKEPHGVIQWFFDQNETLENQIKSALGAYAKTRPEGKWLLDIVGIGPVIAAGLICHINVTPENRTAGQVWRYAGLDPTSKWNKGEKRPWNAELKTLCYKLGESFVKNQNREGCFYGVEFVKRKKMEVENNLAGKLADKAIQRATELRQLRKTDSDGFKWYAGHYQSKDLVGFLDLSAEDRVKFLSDHDVGEGNGLPMLPPAHIHSRARRWTAKLFLSHYTAVAYYFHHGKQMCKPYALAHLNHIDLIEAPNAPWLK